MTIRRRPRWALLAALAAAACGNGKPAGDAARPTAKAPARGVPDPPFEREAPAGAMVVHGITPGHYGGTLSIAAEGNPKTFNPIIANEASTNDIIHGVVYAPLWGFDRVRQESRPELCERFERAPDGLLYTFTLREGLRWSDGEPLTSDDVEFSYRVAIDPNVGTPTQDLFSDGLDAEGRPRYPAFEKIDARTFAFRLRTVKVLFEHAVAAIHPVPRHKWESAWRAGRFDQAMGLDAPPADLVSSGPFRIERFVDARAVTMVRNPYYWKVDSTGARLPYFDRLVFRIVQDFNASFDLFRSGETDLLEVRPEHYGTLRREAANGNYAVYDLGPSFKTTYLMFNLDPGADAEGRPYVDPIRRAWFADKVFRKAISHAIDRESIVRKVLRGRGEPLWSFLSPANRKWYPARVEEYPYDLARTRGLLAEAGFEARGGGLYDTAGNRVEFSVVTNAENAARIGMLNLIKDDLRSVGISVRIEPRGFNEIVTALRDTRRFDAVVLGWGSAIPPDPVQNRNVLLSAGQSHFWHPRQATPATPWEARIDSLLTECTDTFDPAVRKRLSDEVLYIFSDEQPQIQLVVSAATAAARHDVGNFRPTALRPVTHWNVEELFRAPGAGR